jgi:hypothetical protein
MPPVRPNTPGWYGAKQLPVFSDIKDNLGALQSAWKFRTSIGDEKNAAFWEQEVGNRGWKQGDIVYGKGYNLGTRMPIQGPKGSAFSKAYNLGSHEGIHFRELAALDRKTWRDDAAIMKRRIDELQGFKAAGGEEEYYQQQSERKAQAPAKQRAAMRGAEQLRLRSRSASSILGGGAGPSPARTAQRSAERKRVTARGETSTSGGGVARRRARRGGSYLLQPTGGAREILG